MTTTTTATTNKQNKQTNSIIVLLGNKYGMESRIFQKDRIFLFSFGNVIFALPEEAKTKIRRCEEIYRATHNEDTERKMTNDDCFTATTTRVIRHYCSFVNVEKTRQRHTR